MEFSGIIIIIGLILYYTIGLAVANSIWTWEYKSPPFFPWCIVTLFWPIYTIYIVAYSIYYYLFRITKQK